jgi:CHAT domain-containing protein
LFKNWLFIVFFLFFQEVPNQGPDTAFSKYKEALAFYDADDPSEYTDSMALSLFKEVIHLENTGQIENEVLLDVFEKIGNLYLIKGDLHDAVEFYREGLKIREKGVVNDTLFFATHLFLGETYYLLSQADSSIYFLEEAEKLIQFKSSDTEASRLYNSLGVTYFESGNYTQSVNYFDKAKNLVVGERSFDELEPYFQYALFSFLNNIGSALLQLNKLDSALAIYRKLENSGLNRDQVYTQMGSIFLDKSLPDSALFYLEKIASPQFKESASYKNQLAEVYLLQNETSKAKDVLLNFVSEANEGRMSSLDFRLGRSYRLLGKIAYEEEDYEKAIEYFHQSVIFIDGYFDQEDVFKNPVDYSLGFATFSLIESLVDKAKSFIKLYELNKDARYFEAGVSTYQAAFDMAFFVSNYYDNDEARIFLGDFVLDTYQEAVEKLLIQFQEIGEDQLLFQALDWAERSKSTSLNIGIREKKLKKRSGISEEKIQKESDLQFAISRLQQSILYERDDSKIAELQNSLTDKRLELSRLHVEFNDSPDYVKEKLKFESIDIPYLQKELLNRNTIILSFFETKSKFILFLLDKKDISFQMIERDEKLNEEIDAFKKNIVDYRVGQKYISGGSGVYLFNKFFNEVYTQIEPYTDLKIIPHGKLIDLPFEVLEKNPGEYLVNDHAIAYQYSIQLIGNTDLKPIKKANTVGFAPFFDHSWSDGQVNLTQLPYSKTEIEFLQGEKYYGEASTKDVLLDILPQVDYLQLATHAIPDPQNPDLAFIAFYPGDIEDRLYSNEVVNMDLSHTSLVFLSACETNFGAISRSEGTLSISRAFMLAGCQNIISSLWKAEDMATAYITEAFYKNVNIGHSFSEALRRAKLDLLNDPKMAQFHHPVFWAHLVLVGQLNNPKPVIPVYFYVLAGLILACGYWIYRSRLGKKLPKKNFFFY